MQQPSRPSRPTAAVRRRRCSGRGCDAGGLRRRRRGGDCCDRRGRDAAAEAEAAAVRWPRPRTRRRRVTPPPPRWRRRRGGDAATAATVRGGGKRRRRRRRRRPRARSCGLQINSRQTQGGRLLARAWRGRAGSDMRRPTRTPKQTRPAWECPRKQTAAAVMGGCDVGMISTGISIATSGLVAQMAERRACYSKVLGSIPTSLKACYMPFTCCWL
jgi:hypothetical protein